MLLNAVQFKFVLWLLLSKLLFDIWFIEFVCGVFSISFFLNLSMNENL